MQMTMKLHDDFQFWQTVMRVRCKEQIMAQGRRKCLHRAVIWLRKDSLASPPCWRMRGKACRVPGSTSVISPGSSTTIISMKGADLITRYGGCRNDGRPKRTMKLMSHNQSQALLLHFTKPLEGCVVKSLILYHQPQIIHPRRVIY